MTLSRVPASPIYSALVNAASSSCLEIYGGGTAAGSASEIHADRLRLPGLDPDRRYTVQVRNDVGPPRTEWALRAG
ncbi:hypothetical protein ACFYNL_18555 [Streptomyces sp. NPDC007808]|uniref:hypothetical protein n=1 Tax=Streptomyces sp. NPDC007808 TaxID=3364779 RepID=UPI0036AB1C20